MSRFIATVPGPRLVSFPGGAMLPIQHFRTVVVKIARLTVGTWTIHIFQVLLNGSSVWFGKSMPYARNTSLFLPPPPAPRYRVPPGCKGLPVSRIRCPVLLSVSVLNILLKDVRDLLALSE